MHFLSEYCLRNSNLSISAAYFLEYLNSFAIKAATLLSGCEPWYNRHHAFYPEPIIGLANQFCLDSRCAGRIS